MDKQTFLSEIKEKKCAIECFPDFFTEEFNVDSKKSLEELKEKYLELKEKYFQTPITKESLSSIAIQEGYMYLQKAMQEQKEFSAHSRITEKVLTSYDELIKEIGNYHFRISGENSYGANQNETNKQILLELSLLYPFLMRTLQNVDFYIPKVQVPDEIGDFEIELIENLNRLAKALTENKDHLQATRDFYHQQWFNAVRLHKISYSDLGNIRKNWRLKRNKACVSILSFFEELEEINMAIHYKTFQLDEIEKKSLDINQRADLGIDHIKKGANYYCYLTREEIKEKYKHLIKKN